MAKESKSKIVAKNTAMGILNNVALVVLNLISRKLFLRFIGMEYLSIGQVITNILSVLAFSELGITNSVLYMLYKPVAEGDERKIAQIIGTYKRLNRMVGCAVFGLGLVCMPFLHLFIRTSVPMPTVYLIFLLNLAFFASTYFCSYRQVLIDANQKNYLVSKVTLCANFCSILIQCGIIWLTQNYYLYLACGIAIGLIQNVALYVMAGRLFPYLNRYSQEKLGRAESASLFTYVKSMFSVKVCGTVINNTDTILVSMIDTIMVGYLANYTIITTRIRGMITVLERSIIHSLGIASVEKTAEEKYLLFKKVVLLNVFIAGFTSVLIGVLWDDFIRLWIGEAYLISDAVMYSVLLNYMWDVIRAAVWMFRDTNGLFVYVKKMLLLNAALNLVLSVVLGQLIGVSGVYYATILANLITDFWYDARLVFRKLFRKDAFWQYNLEILGNAAINTLLIWGLSRALTFLPVTVGSWLLKAVISAAAYVALFLTMYGRTRSFHDLLFHTLLPLIRRK